MNKQTVKEKLERAFERLWDGNPKFRIIQVSDNPIDGQWHASVEPARDEHDSRYEYYEDLTMLEDELASLELDVFLLPAINPVFEYEEEGKVIEVSLRSNDDFAVYPKRSLGGPHYQALYDKEGNRVLYSSTGRERGMEVPEEWLNAFERVAQRFMASPKGADTDGE